MSAESGSAAERKTEVIPDWKREEVDALAELVEAYESVGVVDVSGIASRQLQRMRADLHGTARLRMGRNTLVQRALDGVDEGVEVLSEYVSGQVGVIGTDENPFGLYRQLEASKTPAPIGGGEVAPNDIVIHEGDTGMDPGPFVGELQAVGAAAQIMDGSIKVTADSTVAEAGDVVSDRLAGVLAELDIEPKEVGLDLRAVYSDGVLFEADELAIDVDEYGADVRAAVASGRNLSINAAYPTDRTVSALLARASGEAKSVGIAAEVESPDLIGDLVSRADGQVRALAAAIDDPDALPDDLREAAAGQAGAGADGADDAEQATGEPEPEAETESETEDAEADAGAGDDAGDDDEDDDGGEALGALFG